MSCLGWGVGLAFWPTQLLHGRWQHAQTSPLLRAGGLRELPYGLFTLLILPVTTCNDDRAMADRQAKLADGHVGLGSFAGPGS